MKMWKLLPVVLLALLVVACEPVPTAPSNIDVTVINNNNLSDDDGFDPRHLRGDGGHQHGGQPLQRSTDDHLLVKVFAFVLHQVDVVGNHHDAVAGDNADQCDEAHPMGD